MILKGLVKSVVQKSSQEYESTEVSTFFCFMEVDLGESADLTDRYFSIVVKENQGRRKLDSDSGNLKEKEGLNTETR